MSVYRPSNARPFLDSIDLTKEQFFNCEVHTSNVPITGYKIRILDNLNQVIFEGEEYSPIPAFPPQMHLNGATLTVPFIVLTEQNLNFNSIYYDAINHRWYKKSRTGTELREVLSFFNGYINQPYKWSITLAQGDIFNPITGENQYPANKWYDMTVATGQVMGTTINRIQSELSDHIYKDYFIQLCKNTYTETATPLMQKKAFIGTRKLISRYDSSFGYIYPQEGKFTQADIDAAEYFQIFKSSNDISTLNSNRVVDFATNRAMSSIKLSVSGNLVGPTSSSFIPGQIEGSDGGVYFTQIFKTDNTSYQLGEYPLQVQAIDLQAGPNEYVNIGATRILVKNEGEVSNGISLSPYNGVFILAESKVVIDEDGGNKRNIVLKWQRTSDTRTWGNLIGKIYYVKGGSSGGVSFESTATVQTDTIGSINSTPLGFSAEKPVEIFPEGANWEAKNFGQIYKNTETSTLIRPFTGINKNMRFSYVVNGIENNLNIQEINKQVWKITHPTLPSPLSITTPYKIYSYFKQGDDAPFHAFDTPELTIEIEGLQNDAGDYKVSQRTLKAIGIYQQAQGKSWKNYRWELLDLGYNSTRATEISYIGEISAEFEGLEDGRRYGLLLEVEDEMGFVHSAYIYFRAELSELTDGDFALKIGFDRSTHSVDLDFSRYAFVAPSPSYDETVSEDNGVHYEGITEEDGKMIIDNATVNNGMIERGYGIKYNKIQVVMEDADAISDLLGPATNGITLNSSHILNSHFEGIIYEAVISDMQEADSIGMRQRAKIQVELPTEIIEQEGWTIANPQRNQIIASFKQERSFDGGNTWVKVDNSEVRTPITVFITENGVPINKGTTWRLNLDSQDSVVVGALVNGADTNTIREGYDYLLTQRAYNLRNPSTSAPLEGKYRHLIGTGLNSSSAMASSPLGLQAKGGTFWYDGVLILAKQADESVLNVEKIDIDNIWDDSAEGANSNDFWYEQTSAINLFEATGYEGLYKPVDINTLGTRRTGRQEIGSKRLIFNVAVLNYDTTKIVDQQGFKIEGRCFMIDE